MTTMHEPDYVKTGEEVRLLVGPDHDRQWWITKAEPPCDENRGQWYCVTCQEGFQNNWQASSHSGDGQEHRFVWMCVLHGPEQGPTDN